MILALNGLWDVITSQESVYFIKERYLHREDFGETELVVKALRSKSIDNITVMIAVFQNGYYKIGTENT